MIDGFLAIQCSGPVVEKVMKTTREKSVGGSTEAWSISAIWPNVGDLG